MKKLLTNNIGLKFIAVLVAFIIWLVVVNISNPEIRGSKTVGLEIVNEDVITRVGKTFDISGSSTVTVSYSVRTRDAYKVKASDFRAYIDLNDLYDVTGSVPVVVDVVDNKDLFIEQPTAKPAVLRLSVENIVRKSVSVKPYTDGEPEAGYSVGDVEVDPSTVQVTGPQSIVDRISYAELYINTSGLSEDTGGSEKPVFYDAEGNQLKLTDSRISLNHDKVDYYVTMLNGKSVPVSFGTSGTPADGFRLTGIEPDLSSVIVMGKDSDLEKLDEIRIPEERINITGAVMNMTFPIDINDYLPDGYTIMGDHDAKVTVRIESLNTRSFTYGFDELGKTNPVPDRTYSMDPGQITLVITGLSDELAGVDKTSLNATIDLTNMDVGSHTGHINCNLPEGCSVKSCTPFTINVEIYEEILTWPDTGSGTGEGRKPETEKHTEHAGESESSEAGEEIDAPGDNDGENEAPGAEIEKVKVTEKQVRRE